MHRLAIIPVCALAVAACTPVVRGGEPLPMSAELAAGPPFGDIRVSSDWIDAEDDITATFTDEVREELSRCSTGPRVLDLNVCIDDLDRASRLGGALNGLGMNTLPATAELTAPSKGELRSDATASSPRSLYKGAWKGSSPTARRSFPNNRAASYVATPLGQDPRERGPHNATRDWSTDQGRGRPRP